MSVSSFTVIISGGWDEQQLSAFLSIVLMKDSEAILSVRCSAVARSSFVGSALTILLWTLIPSALTILAKHPCERVQTYEVIEWNICVSLHCTAENVAGGDDRVYHEHRTPIFFGLSARFTVIPRYCW